MLLEPSYKDCRQQIFMLFVGFETEEFDVGATEIDCVLTCVAVIGRMCLGSFSSDVVVDSRLFGPGLHKL